MPEIPDFDQLARRLIDGSDWSIIDSEHICAIAEQLRQVWNARGAADLSMLEAEGYISGAYVPDVARAIKKLDG